MLEFISMLLAAGFCLAAVSANWREKEDEKQ